MGSCRPGAGEESGPRRAVNWTAVAPGRVSPLHTDGNHIGRRFESRGGGDGRRRVRRRGPRLRAHVVRVAALTTREENTGEQKKGGGASDEGEGAGSCEAFHGREVEERVNSRVTILHGPERRGFAAGAEEEKSSIRLGRVPAIAPYTNSTCSVRGWKAGRVDVWTSFDSRPPHVLASNLEACYRIRYCPERQRSFRKIPRDLI